MNRIVCVLLILSPLCEVMSQEAEARRVYIETYAELAIKEMQKHGIPASITLAQGLLESNNGTSELTLTANNHFGIKCHTTWTGRRFYYDDDDLNECFRAYRNAKESYEDHSVFLMTRPRYEFLFDLDTKDYKAWARGLKIAGYATNPNYANMLIKIIEDNELQRLDKKISAAQAKRGRIDIASKKVEWPTQTLAAQISVRNRIKFVVAGPDDSVEKLTKEYDKLRWEIRKYNELPRKSQLTEGQIVYLQPKRKHAARGFDFHYVTPGESMYSISQQYGIKVKYLYKLNGLPPGAPVEPGDQIWLRKGRGK